MFNVCWKSVESATTLLIKPLRLSYAVSSAVSVPKPALSIKVIEFCSEVKTGAELSSVSRKKLFKVPRWSFTALLFSAALTPYRLGISVCRLWTVCNISRKSAVSSVSGLARKTIVPSNIVFVCLTRSPRILPRFKCCML